METTKEIFTETIKQISPNLDEKQLLQMTECKITLSPVKDSECKKNKKRGKEVLNRGLRVSNKKDMVHQKMQPVVALNTKDIFTHTEKMKDNADLKFATLKKLEPSVTTIPEEVPVKNASSKILKHKKSFLSKKLSDKVGQTSSNNSSEKPADKAISDSKTSNDAQNKIRKLKTTSVGMSGYGKEEPPNCKLKKKKTIPAKTTDTTHNSKLNASKNSSHQNKTKCKHRKEILPKTNSDVSDKSRSDKVMSKLKSNSQKKVKKSFISNEKGVEVMSKLKGNSQKKLKKSLLSEKNVVEVTSKVKSSVTPIKKNSLPVLDGILEQAADKIDKVLSKSADDCSPEIKLGSSKSNDTELANSSENLPKESEKTNCNSPKSVDSLNNELDISKVQPTKNGSLKTVGNGKENQTFERLLSHIKIKSCSVNLTRVSTTKPHKSEQNTVHSQKKTSSKHQNVSTRRYACFENSPRPPRIRCPSKQSSSKVTSEKKLRQSFSTHKGYLNHLIKQSSRSSNNEKQKELEKFGMKKCSKCSKWMANEAYIKHMRLVHKINVPRKLQSPHKKPCPLSKQKSVDAQSDPILYCYLGADKLLKVSSVLDLPFELKPILMVKRDPYIENLSRELVTQHSPSPELVKEYSPPLIDENDEEYDPSSSDFEEELLIDDISHRKGNQKATKRSEKSKGAKTTHSNKSKPGSVKENHKNQTKKLSKTQVNLNQETLKGKVRKLNRDGFYEDFNSSGESEEGDSSSESDFFSDIESEIKNEISDNIPTVELDLYTLPSQDEDASSVFLRDPHNPEFKVYANYNAIFVGDSALEDLTNQNGYITDNNNVVFVNPDHFLFPELKEEALSTKKSKSKKRKNISKTGVLMKKSGKSKLPKVISHEDFLDKNLNDKENALTTVSGQQVPLARKVRKSSLDENLLDKELSNSSDWLNNEKHALPNTLIKAKRKGAVKRNKADSCVFHLDSSEVEIMPMPSFDLSADKNLPRKQYETAIVGGREVVIIKVFMGTAVRKTKKIRKKKQPVPILTIIASAKATEETPPLSPVILDGNCDVDESLCGNFIVKEDQRLSPIPNSLPSDLDIEDSSLFFDNNLDAVKAEDYLPSGVELDSLLEDFCVDSKEVLLEKSDILSSVTVSSTVSKSKRSLDIALESGEQGVAYIDENGELRSASGSLIETGTNWSGVVENLSKKSTPIKRKTPCGSRAKKSPVKSKNLVDPLAGVTLWDTPLLSSDLGDTPAIPPPFSQSPLNILPSSVHIKRPVGRPKLKPNYLNPKLPKKMSLSKFKKCNRARSLRKLILKKKTHKVKDSLGKKPDTIVTQKPSTSDSLFDQLSYQSPEKSSGTPICGESSSPKSTNKSKKLPTLKRKKKQVPCQSVDQLSDNQETALTVTKNKQSRVITQIPEPSKRPSKKSKCLKMKISLKSQPQITKSDAGESILPDNLQSSSSAVHVDSSSLPEAAVMSCGKMPVQIERKSSKRSHSAIKSVKKRTPESSPKLQKPSHPNYNDLKSLFEIEEDSCESFIGFVSKTPRKRKKLTKSTPSKSKKRNNVETVIDENEDLHINKKQKISVEKLADAEKNLSTHIETPMLSEVPVVDDVFLGFDDELSLPNDIKICSDKQELPIRITPPPQTTILTQPLKIKPLEELLDSACLSDENLSSPIPSLVPIDPKEKLSPLNNFTKTRFKKRQKLKGNSKMRDIRSYFTPLKESSNIQEDTRQPPGNLPADEPTCLTRSSEDERTCLTRSSEDESSENILEESEILKPLDLLEYWQNMPSDYVSEGEEDQEEFNGFESDSSSQENKVETLLRYIDVLNLQNLFNPNQEFNTDELYDYDEEFVNSQI